LYSTRQVTCLKTRHSGAAVYSIRHSVWRERLRGIFVDRGLVVLDAVAVNNNEANGADSRGGGVCNSSGTVIIKNDSKITLNRATKFGGGLFNDTGSSMSIDATSINDNQSANGAGIANVSNLARGALEITNSTLSTNTASAKGGAIYQGGKMTIRNSTGVGNKAMEGAGIYRVEGSETDGKTDTISRNTAIGDGTGPGIGGGDYSETGAVLNLANSIIAGNTADLSPDVFGVVSSTGHNLVGDGTGSSGWLGSDLVGTSSSPIDPRLTSLGDNGRPTQTMLLLSGSPARGAGDPTQVASSTDQRGFARVVNGLVDIGAVEMQDTAVATSVSLSSSLNPSYFGQSVTFSVVVASNGGTPTGTVTFYDDGAALDTETLDSNGRASFTTSTLTVDNHSIVALYSGDGTFAGNTSAVLTQTVNQATTTTSLASSLNPSMFGQSVTFTATVTPCYPSSPAGTVSFYDGTTLLGTASLDATGHASFTISTLAAGNHSITAVYSGDDIFTGSTSDVLTQQVLSA
jgi:hypothetical protein